MFLSIQKPMSLSEMWHTFCEAKQEFIPNYIAYHYFRSKGWVPKLGIKYGTDLGKLLDLVVCLSHTKKIKLVILYYSAMSDYCSFLHKIMCSLDTFSM